ncbi:collagen alpha-4(VI) chain-like isoform X2 [Littorina saxatilis]|uniref:Uncharacterized protein n=1 Tax=Littorina saxatilis TaxID=31220 RepID=A0AAN9G8M8_9CAEN
MNGIYLILSTLCAVAFAQNNQNCTRTLDLVFVVDGSNSVNPFNFRLIVESLRSAVTSLTMGPGNTRVGVVTYGTGLSEQIPMTTNKAALLASINGLLWPDGGTDTYVGIDWAKNQLNANIRSGVPQVIVVLTDGQSSYVNMTMASANAAKTDGITFYAVGVGVLVDREELDNIAAPNANDRVFLIANFTELTQRLQSITVQACEDECRDGVDMVFVLDGSNSVNIFNFRDLLVTVTSTSATFWTRFPQSRLAVITYATGVFETIPITDRNNQDGFTSAVNNLEYPDGGTTTAEAIIAATNLLLANPRGTIPRVIVVITDGQSDNTSSTISAALAAKNENMTLFAMGVGPLIDTDELNGIASADGLATTVADFTVLSQQLINRIGELCGTSFTTAAPPVTTVTLPPVVNPECNKPVDVIFVVDGSSAVGSSNFQTLKNAVRRAALYYDIGPASARVGVVTYATTVTGGFLPTSDRNAVDQGIQNLQFVGGSRETSSGLERALRDIVNITNGFRPEAPKVVVAIIAGNSDNPPRTVQWVLNLRQAGVYVYALAVTNNVSALEMNYTTNNAITQQYRATDYLFVRGQLDNIVRMICARDFSTTTSTTTTTTTTSPSTTTTTPTTTTTATPVRDSTTTTTTTSTTAAPPSPPADNSSCSDSRKVLDIGFLYDPRDCAAFIQCYFRPDNSAVAVRRTCPVGQFWNQARLRCDEACNVDCPEDPCKNLPNSAQRAMNETCRGYWECIDGGSRPRCCASGHSYVRGRGCVEDCTCKDPCGPSECKTSAVCDLKPDWTDSTKFDMMTPPFGWVSSRCLTGQFNITTCSCQ